MVRFINEYGPREHVGSGDVKSLSWLLVKDRVRYFKLVHVFKIVHGNAPGYLSGKFEPIVATHRHNTRSSGNNFHVSKALSGSLTSFAYTAVKEWNELPIDLKSIESEKLFRRKLRDHLCCSY